MQTFETVSFRQCLRDWALANEALAVGCLPCENWQFDVVHEIFQQWKASPNSGALPYLDRSTVERSAPFAVRPWARSALVVAFAGDWGAEVHQLPLPSAAPGSPCGLVSRYGFGQDYHRTGQRLLASLADALSAAAGREVRSEACVDIQAVPEVCMAVQAGVGLWGFNRLLRTASVGPRCFLGVLFVDLELPAIKHLPDTTNMPACDDCQACLRACPTAALQKGSPLVLDRCRGYLSIECRGVLDAVQQRLLGNCLFGCDVCTGVCPPSVSGEGLRVDLNWLLRGSAGEVRRAIAGTVLERAGVTQLRRNAVVILHHHHRHGDATARKLLSQVHADSRSDLLQKQLAALA